MVVSEDPVSWDRKTEEEPTKRPSGRTTISGRGNSVCESEELGGLWDSRLASEVRVGWRLWLVWAAARPLEASGRVNKLGFYLKLGGWGSYARALLENDWSICIFQEYVGCLVDAGLGEDRSGSGQLGSWSLVDETQQKGRNCWF